MKRLGLKWNGACEESMQQLTRTKGWRAGEPHLVVMAVVAFSLLLVDANKTSTGVVPTQTMEEKRELPLRLCWSKTHRQETEFFIRLTKGSQLTLQILARFAKQGRHPPSAPQSLLEPSRSHWGSLAGGQKEVRHPQLQKDHPS